MWIATPESAALVRRGLPDPGRRRSRPGAASTARLRPRSIVRTLGQLERHTRRDGPSGEGDGPARDGGDARRRGGARAHRRLAPRRPEGRAAQLPACRAWRVAELLSLPSGGATKLAIGGPRRPTPTSGNLSSNIGRPARDAEFAVYGDSVQVVPARDGLELNVPKAARAILRAATRPTNRVAQLTVARALPERTTAEALAMGIDTRMSSYKTYYSGTSDRITNLQLGVRALDGTLVAPGGTFSLNEAIGERTVERGFRSAPVIIGNEYAEEVGGGTSQVATTAFNAAWEAGLRITRATSALALHQPLPARPRRDRLLAVARPQVRQRHRHLGARQGIRRRGRNQHRDLRRRVAPRRELGVAAGRHGPRARRARRGSDARRRERRSSRRKGRRRRGTSATRKVYCRRRRAHPLGDVDDVVRGREPRRPRRDEGRAEEAEAVPTTARADTAPTAELERYPDEASAVAIASASHAGTRVGRYVSRSTVACRV